MSKMIEKVSFFDSLPLGPSGEPFRTLNQDHRDGDVTISLYLDDDPRFIKVVSTRMGSGPSAQLVQLVPMSYVSCITIGKEVVESGKPKKKEKQAD